MNYSKQIFEMLGIKPNEWFKLNTQPDYEYRMNDELCVFYRRMSDRIEFEHFGVLYWILTGYSTIVKIPKQTSNEQIAIDYARACGCKWLTKDRNNMVNAFIEKPVKHDRLGMWELIDTNISTKFGYDCIEINIPISFIHWEDDEPYYIGD